MQHFTTMTTNRIVKLIFEFSFFLSLIEERQPVWLSVEEKTQALMLSSDRTEVVNFNWTFESVHANVAVGRHAAGSSKPAGWYYEVQVMTQGIMQVGELLINSIFQNLIEVHIHAGLGISAIRLWTSGILACAGRCN